MECNGQQCSTLRTNSDCESDSCSDGGCECPSGQDLLKFGEIMWHKAAMAAMFEAKKDRIKSRLEKSFGPTLDKGADAVVEAIQKKIQTAVASTKTEQELHNKLVSILTEATN
jgi:hypothetical protein